MNERNDGTQDLLSRDDHAAPYQAGLTCRKSKEETAGTNTLRTEAETYLARRAGNGTAAVFQSHRRRLFAVAYRMLGSRAEAEDLVQDAYLHWHESASDDIQSPVAFLVTMTTRLCLDRLRELKRERERHLAPWPPEPIAGDQFPSPEMQLEFAEEVSAAFLAVFERLGPEERAAFLLHEVFDYGYPEVAQVLGKAEPTCRQTIRRARVRLCERRSRFALTPESRRRVLDKFVSAVATGERKAVVALLAEDVEYAGSGRGKAGAAPRVTNGPGRTGASTADAAPRVRRMGASFVDA